MNKCTTSPNDISELERLRNSHAALVGALQDLIDKVTHTEAGASLYYKATLIQARAALALAKEATL